MFKKVSKLKQFGIFRDFEWGSDTPDFSRFNLIYGWNKSGKTTFSRAFVACEKKTTDFPQYPIYGEFEIQTESVPITHSSCQSGTKQIRVFNRDFIEENVSFDPKKKSSHPIVYVSEEDIESRKRLNELQGKVNALSEKGESVQRDRQKNEKAEDSFRISTASSIKTIVGNFKVNDKYRNYHKGNVETKIEEIGIENFSKLADDDFEKKRNFIGDDPQGKQSLFSQYDFFFSYDGKSLGSFTEVFCEVSILLKLKVVAETIDRFKDDPDLNKWAQHGFELHKTKDEKKKCLFCQNELSESFLDSLSKHFSGNYEKLQSDIKSFIASLGGLRRKVEETTQQFYSNLQEKYENHANELNRIVGELNTWSDEAAKKLEEKYDNPLSEVSFPQSPEDFSTLYDRIIDDINSVITEHNTQIENHEQEVKQAKEELEKHLIAVAIEEQGYSKIKSEFEKSIESEKRAKQAVDAINREISELEKETSNIGKAVQKINQYLEEFFGRKEILLELDDSKKGYSIQRDGDVANNLSEGEKNAIAFSYFMVKTQERGFNVKEGIIVIDDPISSFDSNFIHHCFSLITNHFREAEQLIISTHNFHFFNLVKNWFEHKNRRVESDNKKFTNESDKKPLPCEFYRIENIIEDEKRYASIVPLEDTLRNFKSEYHFLFSRLDNFITESIPDYADYYTIGNIARRFFEIYINFKIPTTGDLKSRLHQLDTESVRETEKDKVYNLIQEFSHGLDPTSTIEHKDKNEIQSAIEILMKIVEESDEKHFQYLTKSLEAS